MAFEREKQAFDRDSMSSPAAPQQPGCWEQEKQAFDRDGFVIVRQLLPAAEFCELADNLDRYIAEVVPALPDADAFYQVKGRPETLKQLQHMGGRNPYFEQYRRHPRWRDLAEALIGEPAEAQEPEWFNKPPGTEHATPPHQDNYYFNLTPPYVLTIWMALDIVDEENGCLRYVAGSHAEGIRPHGGTQVLGFSQGIADYGDADRLREVPIFLEPGDIVAHHGNTIHRADANRSATRNRRAFAMVFRGESCRRDEEGYRRYEEALQQQHAKMGLQTT
jgi:phytanoyl-CoA hydroxylase